jgi:hypothetical protein
MKFIFIKIFSSYTVIHECIMLDLTLNIKMCALYFFKSNKILKLQKNMNATIQNPEVPYVTLSNVW